ncbi:MAG: purine-nucleoside phosphorylase [Spirochaetales bacterium]|nr:purine-nucleoside phosphorylase [Spirochaetales bacterium]MCF7937309.1 purine-nucleoside phosphorylase [Spirochaetales bacterium]
MDANIRERRDKAVASVRKVSSARPRVGIILGSGLASIADAFTGEKISYKEIEDFPQIGVVGHVGVLKVNDTIAVMGGRFHYYEGNSLSNLVLPVLLLQGLGVEILILTNASGGIGDHLVPGDLVVISDHINMLGANPLWGPNDEQLGPRFPDMSSVYDPGLMEEADKAAGKQMKRGVYAAMIGPSYETPAEVRMLKTLGADMVGMSTVPEAIVAAYLGMRVLGISTVTNYAAGISDQPLNHEEVVAAGKSVKQEMTGIVTGLAGSLGRS